VVNGYEGAMGGSMGNANNWDGVSFNRPLLSNAQDPVVVCFNKNTGSVIAIEDVERPFGFNDEVTALAVDNFGNYIVGGYVTSSLFNNDPNVPVITNSGGDSDFWFARLAKTDCNGVPLSNDSFEKSKASISPNPAQGRVQVNGDENFSSYSIYNIAGQEVLSGNLSSDQQLNISTLSLGMYFLNLQSDVSNHILKLIKE
jgi:hypothetical protein